MSTCKDCRARQFKVEWREGAVKAAARKAVRTGRAKDIDYLAHEKSLLVTDKQNLADHEAQCEVAA